MKRILLILALLVLGVGSVRAQEVTPPPAGAPTLSAVGVRLWPEYDRPEMLVVIEGQFAADTALPLPVELRIPASVGQPSAVAYVGTGGELLTQPYTTRVEGDSLVVSFELSTPGFQLEYYAPLILEGTQRTFTYSYTADYPTAALTLSAQVPPTAQEFSLDPPAGSAGPQNDGLTYHQSQAGPLEAGDTQSWTVRYQKPDSTLTRPPAQAGATPAAAPTESQGSSTAIFFFVAFVILAGVAAGAFWLGRRVQTASSPADLSGPRAGEVRRPGTQGGTGMRAPGERSIHCYQCRVRLRPDAEFCHKCGAKVREP